MAYVALVVSAPTALATYVNYTLVIDPDAADRVQINLPTVDYEENTSVKVNTRNPSVYVFQDFIMVPHTNTGWHIHPGLVLITVADGSVDWYDAKCVKQTRKAGDFFTESDQLHFVRNTSAVPARLIITFVIGKGETNKIYRPPPPCAAAAGLVEPRIQSLK